jgi:ferredoxin-NADP reductase
MKAIELPGKVLRAVTQRMLLDRPLEGLVRLVSPTWSHSEVRARVVAVREEVLNYKTVVLSPNGRWAGFRAGQSVPVAFEVNGVRTVRCYALSSAPFERGRLELTVERHPGGKVSGFIHEHLRVGAIVTLGAAAGALVLEEGPGPVLLLAGGSGITPMRSHTRELARQGRLEDVILLHSVRDASARVFEQEFRALRGAHPGFRYLVHETGGSSSLATAASLGDLVPDFSGRTALAAGPDGFVDAVERVFEEAGARDRLRTERFTPAAVSVGPRPDAHGGTRVRLLRSGISFTGDGRRSLLVQAEEAGARLRSGCRMGICQLCACTKRRGAVVNLLTGKTSREPGETIQLCVSVALSGDALELEA